MCGQAHQCARKSFISLRRHTPFSHRSGVLAHHYYDLEELLVSGSITSPPSLVGAWSKLQIEYASDILALPSECLPCHAYSADTEY